MKCPNCGTTEDIKFFLRHQDKENDDSNVANVITIICTKCGKNESYFLEDCLPEIFPSWKETPSFDIGMIGDMLQGMSENNFSEGLITEER